jgi:hypothetical protein
MPQVMTEKEITEAKKNVKELRQFLINLITKNNGEINHDDLDLESLQNSISRCEKDQKRLKQCKKYALDRGDSATLEMYKDLNWTISDAIRAGQQVLGHKPVPKTIDCGSPAVADPSRITKIYNRSNEKIKVVVSDQPTAVSICNKHKARTSIPYDHVGANGESQQGNNRIQEAVLLPNSRGLFELPWKNFYLTILIKREDGVCIIHERNRLVRCSQNYEFLQSDLENQVQILTPPVVPPPPTETSQEPASTKKESIIRRGRWFQRNHQ